MLHHNRRSVHSQLQSNISLQESPIHAPSLYDSDHSPQPYFYPTSFQPKNPKVPRQVDLKVTITNLLSQLKEWLIDLCLTEHCTGEVNEQLQPIIEQMIDNVQQEEEESYWIDPYNCHKNGHRRSLNDSDNVVISNQALEIQQFSVITLDSKTQVALLGENDKNLVQIFFKRYYRLFQNCLSRIKRFSGQKKLKFLVDTTVKNIFSQTLRVSYDLKLIQHKISQQKQIKADLNRIGYINLLAERITMIMHDRGNIRAAFKSMKTQYIQQSKKDNQFIGAMMKKITKLCMLYDKNKRWAITHHLYAWRQRSLELKIAQQQVLITLVRTSIEDILPSLAPTAFLDDFRFSWRSAIQTQLNLLIDTLFTGEDCLFISMQSIMQTNRIERNTSLVQLLQEQEQLCATHRTHQWKEHPFLNQFTIEELKNCIISGEIYKSDRNNSSLLLIPIKPAPGIIFASLSNQSHPSLSFSKSPMNLRSFRMLLRLVELITPLLTDLAELCKKVQLQWEEIDCNNHYQMLFKQFVKSDLLESTKNGHLQVAKRGEEGLQIDSHRLESPNSVIAAVMDKLSIVTLTVYHHIKPSVIRKLPCVTIGESDAARSQKHIIQSIYTELLNSGKEIMTITRNGNTFTILPLKKNGQVVGMIHCVGIRDGAIQYNLVSECLVPLIMKHQGAIECQECQVKVTVPEKEEIINGKEKKQVRLPYEEAIDLIISENIYQLQGKLKLLLQKQGHFFQKMVFRLDISDPSTYYYFNHQKQAQMLTLANSQQIYHSDIFIEENYSLSAAGPLSKIVHSSPCFNNAQVHIYELQATHCFRVIGIPIKNEKSIFGYWLIGHYLKDQLGENEGIIQWTKSIGGYLSMNNLFLAKKIDSQEMMKDFSLHSQAQDQRQRRVIERINSWRCQGKLYERIYQLNQLISFTKPSLRSSTFKLKSSNQLSLIYTSKLSKPSQTSITLTPQLAHCVKDVNLISSHERLLSQTCNISQKSDHRTIRPLKSQKLHNSFIFLPSMKTESKLKLLNQIKQKYQLQGWISTEHLPVLEDIQSWAWGEDQKQEDLICLMNVGRHRDESYYFMLNIPFKQNDVQPLTGNILAHLHKKCSHIIAQSFSLTPTLKTKLSAIGNLSNFLQGNLTPKHCVNQFRLYLMTEKSKLFQLVSSVSKIIHPQFSKLRRYYELVESGFTHIHNKSKQIRDRYVRFSLMTVPLIEKACRRCKYVLGFGSIQSTIQQPCRFSYIRGFNKLSSTLSKVQNKHIHRIWYLIKAHLSFKATNSRQSKILSATKMSNVIKMTLLKQNIHFFSQVAKFSQQFQMTFRLISQQFQRLSFTSREYFLKFANQRFQTIFSHYEFGLISKIELMCGVKSTKRNVIYKIGAENRLEEFIEFEDQSIKRDGIITVGVQTNLKKDGHSLIVKITTKNGQKATKQTKIVLDAIQKALVPCYSNYLSTIQDKTDKLCSLLLRVACKQTWNSSCSQPQQIYAFHPDKCIEEQCLKLKFINILKSLKRTHQISQTKVISAAINQESKAYYNLQYEYNAISAILAGKKQSQGQQFSQIVQKYGDIVTREQLGKLREELQLLETQQQKKMLQYQIKSKTFATSQIITFLEKRSNNGVQNTSYRYLSSQNKENRRNNNSNLSNIQRAYVDQKIELAAVKNQINEAKNKQKRIATRNIWLVLSRILRAQKQREVGKVLDTLLLPKQIKAKSRF